MVAQIVVPAAGDVRIVGHLIGLIDLLPFVTHVRHDLAVVAVDVGEVYELIVRYGWPT